MLASDITVVVTAEVAVRVTTELLEPAADTLSTLGIVLDDVELTVPFPNRYAEETIAVVVVAPGTVKEVPEDSEGTGFEVTGMLERLLAGPVIVLAAKVATMVAPVALELKAEDVVPGATACPEPLALLVEVTLCARNGEP